MADLVPGDPAPEFRLQDAYGKWYSLADFAGSKVILYFYPAALTPHCTVQAIDFTATLSDFSNAGYTVLGVSPDDQEALKAFIIRYDLTVTLLSDPDMSVINAYGAWGNRMLWGKEIEGFIRCTFIIDVDSEGKGTISHSEYAIRGIGHVKHLQEMLGI